MLAGDNSRPSVLPRLQVPDAPSCWWTPTIRASAVANAEQLPGKTCPSGGIPAPVAANSTAIITQRSTFCWPGRGPRFHGTVEAPGFSRGVLHVPRQLRIDVIQADVNT